MKILDFLKIQSVVFIYSLAGVFSKAGSGQLVDNGVCSVGFITCLAAEIGVLGLYAIFWQRIIKERELSVAYLNKALGLFWSLLWSALLFKEQVTLQHFIGILFVVGGIMMVNDYDR